MQPPPLLFGATLLFWGWQTGFPVMGGTLAVLIEGVRLLRHRWEMSDGDFNRLWNFTALLFIAAAVFAFTTNQGGAAIGRMLDDPNLNSTRILGEANQRTSASLLQWMPMIFFPFVLSLVMCRRGQMKLTVFSLIARRAKRQSPPGPLAEAEVNPAWAYFGVCLVSACINTNDGPLFFAGTTALVMWALWTRRSPRYSLPVWGVTILAACALAYVTQQQLGELRRFLENYTPQWSWRWGGHRTNPNEVSTSIGQIGRLKGSGTIVIRLEPKDGTPAPSLLRTASYRYYRNQTWAAGNPRTGTGDSSSFTPVVPEGKTATWILRNAGAPNRVNIASYLEGGKDLLPLPPGSVRLEEFPAIDLGTNNLGAALADGPGLVLFDVLYGPKGSIDSPPGTPDFKSIPELEKPALEQVITELKLGGQSTNQMQMLRTISAFFQDKFTYSTWQRTRAGRETNATALGNFLLRTRAGHCEYFATATVLLLRQLGIPARYAVGWSVQEASGRGYVIRERHAHAWCLVYYNDQWHDFDTTPASWSAEENKRASPLQFLSDAWSRFKFEFMKVRWGQSNLRNYIWWIVGPMLLFLLYRLFRSKPDRRSHSRPAAEDRDLVRLGLDSEFYQVERKLAELGFVRQPGETLGKFLERAVLNPRVADMREALSPLLRAHYRLRFDPAGLGAEERSDLRRRVRETLARLAGSEAATP